MEEEIKVLKWERRGSGEAGKGKREKQTTTIHHDKQEYEDVTETYGRLALTIWGVRS